MPVVNYHTVNGQMVGQSTGSTFTQYLTDALGSVTATVNGKRVTNTYRYKPYGERLAKNGTGADPDFQWTGDTGSRVTGRSRAEQYNRARHYGTGQASWTTVDRLWPDEFQYLYTNMIPTSYIDPSGSRRDYRSGNTIPAGAPGGPPRQIWGPPYPVFPPRLPSPTYPPRSGPIGWPGGNGGQRTGGGLIMPPWIQPPFPSRPLPSPGLPGMGASVRPCFETWTYPLPKEGDRPRFDPVTAPLGTVIDPCHELRSTKARRCPEGQGGKSGFVRRCLSQPRPDRAKCDQYKMYIREWGACCDAREDELRWRCLDNLESIPGHENQLAGCRNAEMQCAKVYRQYCRGRYYPDH